LSYVNEALNPYTPTRQQEREASPGIHTCLTNPKPHHGFCETCQRHMPAPRKRRKGWQCDECQSAKSTKQ